jgi:oxepin-CoA hydrolase/3-oxo-5,6-dehydrosuberyl-CoA semialdehyde dehydrogenase
MKLKQHPAIIENATRFNMEADSLNFCLLGDDVEPGMPEFDLFVKEVAREMTVKAGQKCTAIRRTIVPDNKIDAVVEALGKRLSKTVIGDPKVEGVRMGPLASRSQQADVRSAVENLAKSSELVLGNLDDFDVLGADKDKGAFFPSMVLLCKDPIGNKASHEIEPFGPVSTVMPYSSVEQAVELIKMGKGSLVGSVFTASDAVAKRVTLGVAAYHGRLVLINEQSSKESTGHGSPMPQMVHGGPGRAGGGEELGGIRSVLHYMQRTALQGSPTTLTNVCNEYMAGAKVQTDDVHPFRKYFEELEVGDSILTDKRIITLEDVESFAALSGDHFYAHMDEEAAKASPIFEGRVAHGYFVLSAAAGLFVEPAPGPVIANYGLENLRFTEPVYPGDSIQVKFTCKSKIRKYGKPEGVIEWDVEVKNQKDELVAVYSILTLVATKAD